MLGGILTVGREVLMGRVTDTNATHIARELTCRGVMIARRATVDDDPEEIVRGLRWLQEEAQLVVITGGLGPTDDDLTLEAVAMALKRPVREHPEVRRHIESRIRAIRSAEALRDPAYLQAVRKMSRLPEGGAWLPNPVGVAPGVWIPQERGGILLLPGVPEEMKALLERFFQRYARVLPNRVAVEETYESPLPYEALLAPHLEAIRKDYPDVYIKSHVRPGERPRVTIQVWASTWEEGQARIREVWDALRSRMNAS